MIERSEILGWLRESRPEALDQLWSRADDVRRETVGDAVFFRGLIEVSNHCVRQCHYCGIRGSNEQITRYRMTHEEIMACARAAVRFCYGTVVIQAGEDLGLTREWVTDIVKRIKCETGLAITLSLGERSLQELTEWREAGADRYLLRFETSNRELFRQIHPAITGRPKIDRIDQLKWLRQLDYEVGSGVMIGIPGETYEDLANDIELFRSLDLDMIGVGPFIAHPSTPLGAMQNGAGRGGDDQVPNTEMMTYKVVSLARLVCPNANIPSTTALATLNLAQGRELGLMRGANVVMPNLTPPNYRQCYEIYPAKACIRETADQCSECLLRRIRSIGRRIGVGPGPSPVAMHRRIPTRGSARPRNGLS